MSMELVNNQLINNNKLTKILNTKGMLENTQIRMMR